MGNFNRGRSGGGRNFERRGFNDRGSRGSVQMHQAVCDSCRKSCEVPFRPTSGKPLFCNDCFQSNRGSDSKRFDSRNSERSSGFEDRQMFEAVCDECRNSCKVPFRPSGEKPVYCSDCFGGKKGSGDRKSESVQPQYTEQFEVLNNKLDRILAMLIPNAVDNLPAEDGNPTNSEENVISEKTIKAKKSPSKKKSSKVKS